MSGYEHRNMAYLLEDVMKNKFNRFVYPEDLWEYTKNIETEEYNMKDVKHWVYKTCWSNNDCFYSIYQVLMQKSKFKEDMKRIKKSDTSFPLIVLEDEFDKYGSILDGNHRFAKLIINNSKKVKFKFITRKELISLMVKV